MEHEFAGGWDVRLSLRSSCHYLDYSATLAVRGFDAAQIGPAILWTALPELLLAFLGAFLLNRGFDTRLLMAIGFVMIAFACLMNANFTSTWSAENYFRTELLMAVGQSFAFMGLVSSLILQAISSER